MRRKVGYGYTPPRPRITDRNGRNTISDFPLEPETPVDIRVHASAPTNVPQPANTAAESCAPAAPNTPQEQPPVPPAPETIIPLAPIEAVQDESIEDESVTVADVEAEAAALLAKLRAAGGRVEPAPAQRRRPPAKKRRKKTCSQKSKSLAPQPSNLSPRDHHERHCSICNHEHRDAIEEEFIHWHRAGTTAWSYAVPERAIYRHAHATGLFATRERNLRSALGHIVENASRVKPTADAILRAIRAYSCLNRDGQWTEPPAHVIVSSGSQLTSPQAIAAAAITVNVPPAAQPPALPTNANSIAAESSKLLDSPRRVEIDATC